MRRSFARIDIIYLMLNNQRDIHKQDCDPRRNDFNVLFNVTSMRSAMVGDEIPFNLDS